MNEIQPTPGLIKALLGLTGQNISVLRLYLLYGYLSFYIYFFIDTQSISSFHHHLKYLVQNENMTFFLPRKFPKKEI
uniref:Uncharacterized protein n=1 Tax=Candidatus Kentrum sp. FW TaxID=2126338 RepID=A0A450U4P1_9GAMM|nr:MAG: hypothetical protein BECKFW1821C_GA0114237_12232 [Candidatus Kentron sp. FW]